ncbi:MAG: hypothetical protein UHX00_07780 [Caryophanon sp.]|nr:hypothetical protein [Caryophanon sp.]
MHEEKNSLTVVEQLQQFEEKYEQLFQGVAIISEVTMDEGDYDSVLELVKQEIETADHAKATTAVWTVAPKTMLLFTTTFATNAYDANFWQTVGDELVLHDADLWRDAFMIAVEASDVHTFKAAGVQKYTANILGHTTIPRAQVKTFVTRIIQPALEHGYSAEDIQTMMQHDAKATPVKSHGLIRAVKDFVKQQDLIVTDVLTRAMNIWKTQNRPFVENFAGVLPQHLLQEFDAITVKTPRKAAEVIKLATERPVLRYNLAAQQVELALPVQTFRRQVAQAIWTVNDETIQTARYAYENGEIDFEAIYQVPATPATTYNVQLTVDGVVQGEWFLATEDFMYFDATTFEQIQAQEFSAKQVIAVFAKKHQKFAAIDGIAVTPTALKGAWNGYTAADVHVHKAFAYNNGDKRLVVYATARQFLLKGQKQKAVVSSVPVYNGNFSVVIGKKTFASLEAANVWTLTLTHVQSGEFVSINVKELELVENELGHFELPFVDAFTAFMADKPGHYTIQMTSVLGKDAKTTFVYVPENVVIIEQVENKVLFQTEQGYKLVPSNVYTHVFSATKNEVTVQNMYETLHVTLTMPRTKEKLHFTYYPQQVAVSVASHNVVAPLGYVTTAKDFDFATASLVIDTDATHGYTEADELEVVVYEQLQDGAVNEVAVTAHTTHTDALSLAQFADATNTADVRTLHVRIDALELDAPLVTVYPSYEIADAVSAEGTISVLFTENVQATVRVFDFVTRALVTSVEANGQKVTIDVPAGHYIVSLQEDEAFPTTLSPRMITVAVQTEETFAQALLFGEQSDEGEWEEDALLNLLSQVYEYEEVYVPVLIEDYMTCVDFGMINIDALQNLIATFPQEARTSSLLISGFQEWDHVSVERALGDSYVLVNDKAQYAPKKLSQYDDYKIPQLRWSYNYHVQGQQVLKGFSLTHEVLKAFTKQQTKAELNAAVAFVQRFTEPLDALLTTYAAEPMVEAFAATLAERKDEAFVYTCGLSAFWNSMLFYHERTLQAEEVALIRETTPALYTMATKLFMHDLVFWHAKLDAFDEAQKEHKARRKQFENPSFGWKR